MNNLTPEQEKAFQIEMKAQQYRKAREDNLFFHKCAQGISPNPLKFPNPKTPAEREYYFKLMQQAIDKERRLEIELTKEGYFGSRKGNSDEI